MNNWAWCICPQQILLSMQNYGIMKYQAFLWKTIPLIYLPSKAFNCIINRQYMDSFSIFNIRTWLYAENQETYCQTSGFNVNSVTEFVKEIKILCNRVTSEHIALDKVLLFFSNQKVFIFTLLLHENLRCGCSFEALSGAASNEYPEYVFVEK